jgi:hypothetical protein
MRPIAHVAGIVSAILALVNVTAMFVAAAWTDMSPRTRLLAIMGHLSATGLFIALTALLLREKPAG